MKGISNARMKLKGVIKEFGWMINKEIFKKPNKRRLPCVSIGKYDFWGACSMFPWWNPVFMRKTGWFETEN